MLYPIKTLDEYNAWLAHRGGSVTSFRSLRTSLNAQYPQQSPAARKNGERIMRAWRKIEGFPPSHQLTPRGRRTAATICRAIRFYGLGTCIRKRGYQIKWIPTTKKLPKGWRAPSVRIQP